MAAFAFDNELYIQSQSAHIRERIAQFGGKLYLEFGGKLFDDFHASRVLPGFAPDSKIRMLEQLKDNAEIVIVINAADIEKNKVRQDLGITYDMDVLRLRTEFIDKGFMVSSVVITHYNGQSSADNYRKRLERLGVKVFLHYTIEGYRYSHYWSPNRKVYFVLQTDQKIEDFTAYDGNKPKSKEQWRTPALKAALTFGNVNQVQIKVALSSVSCENAAMNLKAELDHWNFDAVVKASADRWNEQLQKIVVEGKSEADKRIFYTAHYHTMITPSTYCDVNGEYRGMDDMIYTSPTKENYTTLSLWDTYRTLQPLMTLTQAERVPGIVNSMLSIYRQQNKLPIWALHNGETECMPGYSSMPIISDAILKGIEGFDYEEAFKAMKASTTYEWQNAVPYILKQEFLPADSVIQATSFAMEYAVGDWGVAAVAKKLGKMEDHAEYAKRAGYYKHYFDQNINFVRPKLSDGSWLTPYDPARSVHGGTGSYFCEGNGWQYTFFVPQDVYGLIELFGGDKPFLERLNQFFVNNDSMGEEASADITGLIGQYAHGNEPSHHISYMYAYAGQQWKTAEKVRYIMDEFYKDTPDGIIGNEDCGQMSAWYILSSMGFYQMNPADGVYVFGSPRFDKMSVKVRGGKTFTVEAENNSKENIYIQKVFLNGKPYRKTYITYDDILNGSTLKFVMGKKPNKAFGKATVDRPIVLNK